MEEGRTVADAALVIRLAYFSHGLAKPPFRSNEHVYAGWTCSDSRSAVVEVYPALWSRGFNREERMGDRHDAYSIAAWLRRAEQDGSVVGFFNPTLKMTERALAEVEGGLDSRRGVSCISSSDGGFTSGYRAPLFRRSLHPP
jgi:hypothetical protein